MPDSVVMITSFLTFTLLIVASPFLTNVWMKSRLARGLVTTFSGLAAAGFWVMYFLRGEYRDLGVGGWCLLISTVVNFAGLLLVRVPRSKYLKTTLPATGNWSPPDGC